MRWFFGKRLKWVVILLVLTVIGLGAPIVYVESACHAPATSAAPYTPLLTDA